MIGPYLVVAERIRQEIADLDFEVDSHAMDFVFEFTPQGFEIASRDGVVGHPHTPGCWSR